METKPLPKEKHLELENMSLRLHIARRNVQDMEAKFRSVAEGALTAEQLSPDEWGIDLDRGLFVHKTQ